MAFSVPGLAIAALSSFFNGSFPAWQRCAGQIDPIAFNGIVCLGAFLSSMVVPLIMGIPYVFTLYGALGGTLFVFAVLFSFIAIPKAGLAISQAVWSTSAILVSFAWGAFAPHPVGAPVTSMPLSIAAITLIISGALIIVRSSEIAEYVFGHSSSSPCDKKDGTGYDTMSEHTSTNRLIEEEGQATSERLVGLASAAAVGIFGGSVLVPFKFIPEAKSGLAAVPSFGLGALLGTAVAFSRSDGRKWPGTATTLAGIMSGVTWNAGNLCSIVAQGPPFDVPLGIAYPILQCAMLFGGIWGIVVFREIRGGAIAAFGVGATILVAGIVVLTQFGPGAK